MDKNALDAKCEDEIFLNLKIKLSNFEADIKILPLATVAEMKNGITYKKNAYI